MTQANLIDELLQLDRFEPSGASQDLIDQVDDAIDEINAYRPLPSHLAQKLSESVLYERVHSSAVTEGNRLSRRETIVVLTEGIVHSGKRHDAQEVKNLAEAIWELNGLLEDHSRLNPTIIRSLHNIILQDIDDASAGSYRQESVTIAGAPFRPPFFREVPYLVQEVIELLNSEDLQSHPLQVATWIHWAIARIHPFKDGNGRIARLLQDFTLLRAHYVPSTLQPEDRDGSYYDALAQADKGDGRPLLELISKNALKTADQYLAIIQEEQERDDWLKSITKAATERVRQTNHRRFLIFQRSSNLLRNEFANIAEELSERIPDLYINFKDYKSIEFSKFLSIENTGRAKRTWFFGLEFRVGETQLRYIFWYGRHYHRPDDIASNFPSKVVILVSVEEEANYYRALDELVEDRVTLREIIPSRLKYWRRRHDPVIGGNRWDKDITAGQISREFYQEVLEKLGLL